MMMTTKRKAQTNTEGCKKNQLGQLPFSEIHAVIFASVHETHAAIDLGLSGSRILAAYLSRLTYAGSTLSYERLKKKLTPDRMRAQLGYQYDQPWEGTFLSLNKRPFSEIHAVILASARESHAATTLGLTDRRRLSAYLSGLTYEGSSLCYVRLKDLTPERMRAQLGYQYDQPWEGTPLNLNKRPFSEIHAVILASARESHAATTLGLTHSRMLKRYLSGLTYAGSNLYYARLKKLTPEHMRALLGEQYDQPWPVVKITQATSVNLNGLSDQPDLMVNRPLNDINESGVEQRALKRRVRSSLVRGDSMSFFSTNMGIQSSTRDTVSASYANDNGTLLSSPSASQEVSLECSARAQSDFIVESRFNSVYEIDVEQVVFESREVSSSLLVSSAGIGFFSSNITQTGRGDDGLPLYPNEYPSDDTTSSLLWSPLEALDNAERWINLFRW